MCELPSRGRPGPPAASLPHAVFTGACCRPGGARQENKAQVAPHGGLSPVGRRLTHKDLATLGQVLLREGGLSSLGEGTGG